MTIKKNYFWMVATLLTVGLLVGLVFSFSTVKAFNDNPAFGEMSSWTENGYRLVTVLASIETESPGQDGLGSSPAAVSADCTLDTTGAISYWPLNETSGTNFSDTVGTNHGSCAGSACPTPVTGAAAGGQFFIDTDTQIINVPSSTDFDWTAASNFSVGIWVKTTQDCSSNKVFIGRYKNPGAEGSWWVGCAVSIPWICS